jgi:hypothetical protein
MTRPVEHRETGSANTLQYIPDWATFGEASNDDLLEKAPTITAFEPEGVAFPDAIFMQVIYEVPNGSAAKYLPPALAPVSPAFVHWRGFFFPQAPWGPTCIAETNLICRAGFRPRVFQLAAKTDNEAAIGELRSRWGYRTALAQKLSLRRFHDATQLSVAENDRQVLQLTATQPITTSGESFGMNSSMRLAHTPAGPKLVQVAMDFTFKAAEISRPKLVAFEADAWEAPGLTPYYPVSAVCGVADIVLREIKFVSDLDKSALLGTRTVESLGWRRD